MTRTSVRVSWRAAAFSVLLLAYALLTVAVIVPSPVLSLDSALMNLHLRHNYPAWKPWIDWYVTFGQRGPATLLFLPYFLWVAWRTRSTRPLVLLGSALVLLNASVAVVKIATGRLGPLRTHNAHDIFVGGNIYPSGHVSNTVVLYGLIAWIVADRHRKLAIAAAAVLSVTVGAGTIYLDTHWFSDVVGGWIAGALVLLALPTVMPTAQRTVDAAVAWSRRRLRRPHEDVPAVVVAQPAARAVPRIAPRIIQRRSTPVSSAACSHSFAATTSSFDAVDDRTRLG